MSRGTIGTVLVALVTIATVAWANTQPLCCTPSAGAAIKGVSYDSTAPSNVSSQWNQELKCLPKCGQLTPCSFCMQESLFVWTANGWVLAPPSSTGTGAVNS